MRKYALINNALVTEIVDAEMEDYPQYAAKNDLVLDITDLDPQPKVLWVLNGNRLEFPIGESNREQMEIELARKKTDFGIALSRIAIDRIGARNKILNKTGSQVSIILAQLLNVKLLLETGALGTARAACVQFKFVYTEYADIFDFVVREINSFETQFGL